MPNRSPIGSSFQDFIKEMGMESEIQEEMELVHIAVQLEKRRKKMRVSNAELAKRLGISRSEAELILNASYAGLTFDSLNRAANALGCRLSIALDAIGAVRGRKRSA